MTTLLFCGPTLARGEVEARLTTNVSVAGPVALGDVLRAVERGVSRIAIVDGYFDQRQPVWHKEILWALHHGVEVYGAASMGALRAAELDAFGMRGVGRIYELFRDGWLERDDEVAVVHGSPGSGYPALSDALVNMRFTFRQAAQRGVIDSAFAEHCAEVAENTFYAERTYEHVLRRASEGASWLGATRALREWLQHGPEHRVDQKRLDALELLTHLTGREGDLQTSPTRLAFHFSNTHAWNEFRKHHAGRGRASDDERYPRR